MAPGMGMLAGVVTWTCKGSGDGGSGLVGLSGGRGVLGRGSVGFKLGCGSEGLSIVASKVCAYK